LPVKKKIALKDIAKKVGVSTALVSYVLNNKDEEKRVGRAVAKKIRKVALELNYRINHIAQSLKTKKTKTIGIVVADINYRFTSRVMKAIESECRKLHYTVIFGNSEENLERFTEAVNVLVDRQVDGLILVPVEKCDGQLAYLRDNEIPFVLIDRFIPIANANTIAVDNLKTAYRCTQHLISTGHKRIGIITYKTSLIHLHDRKNGYLQALKDAKIRVDNKLVKEIRDKDINDAVKHALDELLSLKPACDAIFFTTDTLAIDGLRQINYLKIKVPDQLGIVSFDESEVFELFYCPITHARQPLERIGQIAVNTLVGVINQNKTTRVISLETDFIIGKSCGES
jgi:LacI family transcriptional regulator